ncbi:YceI family protein [Kangiella marina]|uniref:YceI family protein n=1 Tax=Kangiella marina TaxID=1079178 RepID=A0ABP8IL80_9GAMM
MFRITLLKVLSVAALPLVLAACSSESTNQKTTDWSIESAQSELNFSSTKNGDITETHSFESLSGTVKANGEARIAIDLNSVNTNIEIRDERMQKHVFNSTAKQTAVVKADIDPELLTTKKAATQTINGTLSMAGKITEFTATVDVTPSKQGLTVSTKQPIALSVKALGISEGINKLQEIAGLQSISDEVPVTFSISLTPKK